tara:strand:- start:37 stop:423 length:387 start_codon:yes stop_codon:yes gene_type:complete
MATEILVNDGGAPARILPFVATATVTAGDLLMVHTDGKVKPTTTAVIPNIGVALNGAASGELVNVITGKGSIVRVIQNTNLAAGAIVMVDASNVGEVIAHTGTGEANLMAGMTLEDVAAGAYVKVILH